MILMMHWYHLTTQVHWQIQIWRWWVSFCYGSRWKTYATSNQLTCGFIQCQFPCHALGSVSCFNRMKDDRLVNIGIGIEVKTQSGVTVYPAPNYWKEKCDDRYPFMIFWQWTKMVLQRWQWSTNIIQWLLSATSTEILDGVLHFQWSFYKGLFLNCRSQIP